MAYINKNKSRNTRYFPFKKRVCIFCSEKDFSVDYKKDGYTFRRFLTERGKILPRRMTGTCAKHQRKLTAVIKNARHIGLLPFVVQ